MSLFTLSQVYPPSFSKLLKVLEVVVGALLVFSKVNHAREESAAAREKADLHCFSIFAFPRKLLN